MSWASGSPVAAGGSFVMGPSIIHDHRIYVAAIEPDGSSAGVHLTPIEAIGLAQMLLKAANAEVPS